ncbi:peptidoglycan-recognition protein LB-like [Macrosteles quadrilineatus]|uniref:peptidoglycan-recognition protein LB-like n=1 Tax=Macrosteles quadrilineatus TaxID=74068 RepID=UPI0023E279C7|nr:peptidoglycan-recognition protein LB-like [Macrosteles quadrilineatus]
MGIADKLPDAHEEYKNLPWIQLEIVSRQEWGALPPKSVEEFDSFPIRDVLMSYTETDKCEDKESCIKMMQELQQKHMSEGEPDIRFSYVVGWDERVYEGRGFRTKTGANPRYPWLQGKSVEVALSGQRGEVPRPGEKTAIMYRLLDIHSFDNGPISFKDQKIVLDYEEPSYVDDNKLLAIVQDCNNWTRPLREEVAGMYHAVWGE